MKAFNLMCKNECCRMSCLREFYGENHCALIENSTLF